MIKTFWGKKNKSLNERPISQGSYVPPKPALPPPNFITIDLESFQYDPVANNDITITTTSYRDSTTNYIKPQTTSWFGTGFYTGGSQGSGYSGYSEFDLAPSWFGWNKKKFVKPKLIFETDGIKHKHPLTNIFV